MNIAGYARPRATGVATIAGLEAAPVCPVDRADPTAAELGKPTTAKIASTTVAMSTCRAWNRGAMTSILGRYGCPLMCGIAGVVDANGERLDAVVTRQLALLHHRGPDSSGIHEGRGACIGQARLSIIDLLTGDPPITNEDGSIGVVLNGEIYNFRGLRDQLSRTGHAFSSSGDTEVLAHLAEHDEPVEIARQLDGMFAFALWDEARGRLVLGRDRFGKKPLYYWTDGSRLTFGSEIKAVLADPAVSRRLDPDALPAYLAFGYVPVPGTFFEGVRRVPPGCVLVVERHRPLRIERYWSPPLAGVNRAEGDDLSDAEAVHDVRRCLEEAVVKRLVADVPIGAFLSGGVDSSAVVAIMAAASSSVRTFTIGFEGPGYFDEREHARVIAKRFATEHVELVVRPDAVALVEQLVTHFDEPFGDSSAIPTYLLSELTRAHVKVALCGDGGDELFAGYERFAAALVLARLQHVPERLRGWATTLVNRLPPRMLRARVKSMQRLLGSSGLDGPNAMRTWAAFISDGQAAALLPGRMGAAHDYWERVWAESAGGRPLDRLLDLNIKTYLEGDLLPKVDRTSMANGLEVRAPLLDAQLAEVAARLLPRQKLRGTTTKWALKHAVADLLPSETRRRRKQGFGVPVDAWFRGELRGYLDSMLGDSRSRLRDHVAMEPVETMVREHQAGRADHGHALWSLLTLEVFLRRQGW